MNGSILECCSKLIIILIIMKFKGHVLKINKEDFTLKEQLT